MTLHATLGRNFNCPVNILTDKLDTRSSQALYEARGGYMFRKHAAGNVKIESLIDRGHHGFASAPAGNYGITENVF